MLRTGESFQSGCDGDQGRILAHRVEAYRVPVDDGYLRVRRSGRPKCAAAGGNNIVVLRAERLGAGRHGDRESVRLDEVATPVDLPSVGEDVQASQIRDRP